MIGLFWVYEFSQIIISVFLSTFVFIQTQSLVALTWYYVFMFTGCMIGFVLWGLIMAQFRVSMRLNYLRAFAIYICSFFFLLFFPHTLSFLLAFSLFNGVGLGMFWLGVHSYEMIHTDNSNRDFYSSMVTLGSQIFAVISPLVATSSFLLSEKIFHMETFTLLLWGLPFIYLFALPFIFQLPDYYPQKIDMKEVRRLFVDKKLQVARLYYIFGDYDYALRGVVIPFFALSALGTVVHIGVLETIVGALAIFAIVILAHFRHAGNRIQIMLYAVCGLAVAEVFLFFSHLHWVFYVTYSLIAVFMRPIFRVSEHVVDLESVDLIKSDLHDFYPGLLYRDFMLWVGRMSAFLFIFFLAFFIKDNLLLGKIVVASIIVVLFVKWWCAKMVVEQKQ